MSIYKPFKPQDYSIVPFNAHKQYNFDSSSAAANKVTKITKLVNDGLLAAGFNGTKASITVTVNAPDSDITVYAGYNVGGSDRGFVNTSQYKGK